MFKADFVKAMTEGVVAHHGMSATHAKAAVLAAYNFVIDKFDLPKNGAAKVILEEADVKEKFGSALAFAVAEIKETAKGN